MDLFQILRPHPRWPPGPGVPQPTREPVRRIPGPRTRIGPAARWGLAFGLGIARPRHFFEREKKPLEAGSANGHADFPLSLAGFPTMAGNCPEPLRAGSQRPLPAGHHAPDGMVLEFVKPDGLAP